MHDYMALIQAARKAEGEHEQEKHNNSCASKSGVVSDVLTGHDGNTNPDPKASPQSPEQSWLRCSSN